MSLPVSSKQSRIALALAWALAVSWAWGAEQIVLDGSSGMLPLARALAQAYQQRSSDPQVEIGRGLGTGARLRALADGKIQIALASHGIKPEDVQKGNLRIIEVAKGAIVFAVNASVPLTDITDSQVCDAYSGKVRNWQAFGGSDHSMALFTRPPTEVDPEVIRAKIGCFKELKETETAKVMARGGDMAKALSETPHALGMTSMTVVEQSSGKVRALTLNGIAPTAENVKSGRYALTRDFLFVVKGEPSAAVKKFLDFVFSPEGDRIIQANGAVPLRYGSDRRPLAPVRPPRRPAHRRPALRRRSGPARCARLRNRPPYQTARSFALVSLRALQRSRLRATVRAMRSTISAPPISSPSSR